MALTGTETYGTVVPGFVTDLDGNLAVTTDDTSVQWREGFLRDLDGRLVVAEDTGFWQDGFLRTAGGALCVTTGSVTQRGRRVPGFPTDDDGLICVANDGTPERDIFPGFFFSGGKLAVTGLGPQPEVLYDESWTTAGAGAAGWTAADDISNIQRTTVLPQSAPGCLSSQWNTGESVRFLQSPVVPLPPGLSSISVSLWLKSLTAWGSPLLVIGVWMLDDEEILSAEILAEDYAPGMTWTKFSGIVPPDPAADSFQIVIADTGENRPEVEVLFVDTVLVKGIL